jgi:hypothetical protein
MELNKMQFIMQPAAQWQGISPIFSESDYSDGTSIRFRSCC